MTQRQKDTLKNVGLAVSISAAVVGWGRDAISDRFRVENRLTRIESKVDVIAETVRDVADQGKALADLQARVSGLEKWRESGARD